MLIPLRRRDGSIRAHALIDDEDAHLAEHRWHLSGRPGSLYVSRNVLGERGRSVTLHREILGLTPGDGLEVDHENGNPLDCRRSNMRIVTHALNGQNVPAQPGTSRHRGVSWHADRQRWHAYASDENGRRVFLGYFEIEQDAANAARAYRLQHTPNTNENRSVAA